jgi:hypothetical protein
VLVVLLVVLVVLLVVLVLLAVLVVLMLAIHCRRECGCDDDGLSDCPARNASSFVAK